MKANGLKVLAAGVLLTLVGLPGHGRERALAARSQAVKPKGAAPAPWEKVKIEPGSMDLCSLDMDRVHVSVSNAMQDAECALGDIDVQAELADVENMDVESAVDFDADTEVLAMVQESPETVQEPGDSGNVSFYSTDSSGWLGVTIDEVTADKAKELKLPAERGVLVTAVETDSPAGKAGVKSGDVITELGGQRIEGASQFSRMVRETPPGRVMPLTIWRDGRAQAISATLARRTSHHTGEDFVYSVPGEEMHIPMPLMPPMPAMPPMPPMSAMGEIFAPRTPRLGIDAENLSGDLGKYFGAPDGEGVLVREVRAGSPAEKAGVKAGDVIIKVAGERVRTSSDLRANLRAKRESKTVDVVVLRKGTEMTLPVEVEQVTPAEGRRVARRVAA